MKSTVDMHMHTEHSPDSKARFSDMCESAINKGLKTIAITDHLNIEFLSDDYDVFECITGSHRDIDENGGKYEGKLKILKGVEVGEYILHPEYAAKCLESLDYDVVIGSVHQVRIKGLEYPYAQVDFSKFTEPELYHFLDVYFEDLAENLESYDFDILAHLTCPLRYINGKFHRGVDITGYYDRIDAILKRVIEKDIALELNTSGFGTEVCYLPNEEILKRYIDFGGRKITIGSDAHAPENIGKGFDEAVELLKGFGIDRIYSFEKRRAVEHIL